MLALQHSQQSDKMAKPKGRAHLFKDDEEIVKDYDPEFNGPEKDQDGSDSEVSGDDRAATEHYVAVGESKLRRKDGQALGPKYRGARVSRKALDQDSDDEEEPSDEDDDDEGDYADPELADLEADEAEASDSEIESDDALAESDAERFKDFSFRGSSKPAKKSNTRATAADFMSSSEDEDGGAELEDDDEDGDSEDDEEMDDGLDDLINGATDSEEESEGASEEDEDPSGADDDSEADESEEDKGQQTAKPMLAALSNRADVDKGMAIRQQRQMYDGLLNLRIRLQKALVAANTFTALEDSSEVESEPYEAAEEAAIKLLNTISSLRDGFGPGQRVGEKRKRTLDATMPNDEIWQHLQEEDGALVKFREDRLEKWSKKVQSVTVTAAKGLGAKNKTLLNALQDQLADPDNRLVKRSRIPRSCAPAQAAKKITEDENIYDDADFYQLLLKELVDQRTVENSAEQNSAIPSIMVTAAREAKMRKVVDRKASKGRKMRFTVHEKLQNFMAPEDRRSWEQEQINRFFGTLFGQKMELNEESEDEEMDDVNAEEEGLRLFRN
ncbi:Protein BFR2 [Paramyrothecium foliicola]|nr:Protein BFR2 [Paramyrothecium foliicola]